MQLFILLSSTFEAIQSWEKPRGYAFIIGRSKRIKGSEGQLVHFKCDRFCLISIASNQHIRNTQSRGTGCLFSVIAGEAIDKQS
jgi:hypothetical protein